MTSAREQLEFGLDRVTYSIDLSDEHAAELRDALAQYESAPPRTRHAPGSSSE